MADTLGKPYKLSVLFGVFNYRYTAAIHRARDTDYLSYPKHTIVKAIPESRPLFSLNKANRLNVIIKQSSAKPALGKFNRRLLSDGENRVDKVNFQRYTSIVKLSRQ